MARLLMPVPDTDFDPTESAVPWKLFTDAGHQVDFATQAGNTPACDPLLLTGVVFGQLAAGEEPKRFYRQMAESPAFRSPLVWGALDPSGYDGLLLPGGHAQGMKPYLEDEALQRLVLAFWRSDRPVGAICHGVLVVARTIDPDTGRSVLAGRKTTTLPKYLEVAAYAATFWKLGNYYRTYPAYVQDEVRAAVGREGEFRRGPLVLGSPDATKDDGDGYRLRDGNYVSARWPGDAYVFGHELMAMVEARADATVAGADAQPPA